MSEFFVVALPGLEDVVQAEIQAWFPGLETHKIFGGITVRAPLGVGLSMNLALKTATRVLLRVDTFKCSDFPRLYNNVRSIPWTKWLNPGCDMKAHASTRLSRLKMKKRIEGTCQEAWAAFQKTKKAAPLEQNRVDLYVRVMENQCTLSLDTSGERLHKRGERTLVGEAPLRETIAAALIQLVEATQANAKSVEVVDPMMGSGTFLLEAFTRGLPVEKRHFAFEKFNTPEVPEPELKVDRPEIKSVIGFEADAKTFEAAKVNLKFTPAQLYKQNLFDAEPLPEAAARWLFCNPPYGERLGVKEPLAVFYSKIFAACERLARPDRACFLLPTKAVRGKFILPEGWKVLHKRPFQNGGIPVTAFIFGRKATSL